MRKIYQRKNAQLFRWFAIAFSIAIGLVIALFVNPTIVKSQKYYDDSLKKHMSLHKNKMGLNIMFRMPVVSDHAYFNDRQITYAEAIDLLAHNVGDPKNEADADFCNKLLYDLYLHNHKALLTIEFSNEQASKDFNCGERNGKKRKIHLATMDELLDGDIVTKGSSVIRYPSIIPGETITIIETVKVK